MTGALYAQSAAATHLLYGNRLLSHLAMHIFNGMIVGKIQPLLGPLQSFFDEGYSAAHLLLGSFIDENA
jgi:hypothetical protein